MKVFLDTNVLLSAIISNGICQELLIALKNTQPDVQNNPLDRTTCFTCQRVLLELKEHLPTKFKWSALDTEAAITAFSDDGGDAARGSK